MQLILFSFTLMLISTLGQAQTKGFLRITTEPFVKDFSPSFQVSKCLEWNSPNCKRYDRAQTVQSKQFEPLEPGYYKISGELVSQSPLVEVKLGEVQEFKIKAFNIRNIEKLAPGLSQYLSYWEELNHDISVMTDFRNISNQNLVEQKIRIDVVNLLKTTFENSEEFCKSKKTVQDALDAGEIEVCKGEVRKTVPFKLYRDAQRILDSSQMDLNSGVRVNNYRKEGLAEIFNLNFGFTREDSKNKLISTAYLNSEKESITKIQLQAGTYKMHENKPDQEVKLEYFALLPGNYLVLVKDKYGGGILDILYFAVN